MPRILSIGALVAAAIADGTIARVIRDPLAQFGTDSARRLGASFMPERPQDANDYTEERVSYRTMVANHGTRYSKPQYKQGAIIGTVKVSLFESDIAADLKGKELQAVKNQLGRNQSAQAIAAVTRFVDRLITRALVDINEVNIWEAVVEGVAHLRGNNGYSEDVQYPNAPGHRVTAGGDWTDPDYDPMLDMQAGFNLYASKGLRPARAFAGTPLINTLLSHPLMMARGITVANTSAAALDLDGLNTILQRNQLPAIERYDEVYRREDTGAQPFLKRDAFVMLAATDQTETVDGGDAGANAADAEEVTNTIGYVGMGIPDNREENGRAFTLDYDEHKGGGIEATGWQTSAPVITEPESVFAITGITTGA